MIRFSLEHSAFRLSRLRAASRSGRPAGPTAGPETPPGRHPVTAGPSRSRLFCPGVLAATIILASAAPGPAADLSALLAAIRRVESGSDDSAIGDGGRARGAYQIHLGAWLDSGGRAADWPWLAHSRPACEAAMLRYWARYRATTDEARARIWNGGPRGMRKAATAQYWRRVQAAMRRPIK